MGTHGVEGDSLTLLLEENSSEGPPKVLIKNSVNDS